MNSLKTLEAVGNNFYVAPVQKKLACRGSSNSETVCFRLDRYAGNIDLSQCSCIVKTKNREGKSDLAIPEVAADDKKLYISWMPSSGATIVAGKLLVQVQLEKICGDSSKNINWQSNIMEFEIPDSLDAADEIADQDPTIFQQWEERVNTLYSDTTANIQSMQAMQSQVRADAGTVAQQKQSVEQTVTQVARNAQDAAESAKNASASAAVTQASAAQAQASASEAQTAQGLADGYSNAAKTYSDAAAISAQSAQQKANAAEQAVTQAQQKIDAFSGYTKGDIDNGFANALIGKASGKSVSLDDVQPSTNFRSLLVTGETVQDGGGNPSPDNVRLVHGATALTVSDGAGQLQIVTLKEPLYSLPDGTADSCDIVSGSRTQNVGKIVLKGTENISFTAQNGSCARFKILSGLSLGGTSNTTNCFCDTFRGTSFDVLSSLTVESVSSMLYNAESRFDIAMLKSRLTGWGDGLTSAQKVSLFAAWLSAHPIAVLYKIPSPFRTAEEPLTLSAPSPKAVISVDSGMVSATYSRDVNAAYQDLLDKTAGL